MIATTTDAVYGLQNLRKKINEVGEKESPLFHIGGFGNWGKWANEPSYKVVACLQSSKKSWFYFKKS